MAVFSLVVCVRALFESCLLTEFHTVLTSVTLF